MNSGLIVRQLEDLSGVATSHGVGRKCILAGAGECGSGVTQAAFGVLAPGEEVGEHIHPTMEEFYFFLDGEAEMHAGGRVFVCRGHTFVKIPPGMPHGMRLKSITRFLYWGVAVGPKEQI